MDAHLEEFCINSTVPWRGVRVAADVRYSVRYSGREVGFFYSSPTLLEEAVIGYLLLTNEFEGRALLKGVEERGELDYLLEVEKEGPELASPAWRDDPITWDRLMDLMGTFSKSITKRECPYAFHTVALYGLDGDDVKEELVIVDSSRHSAFMKLVGWAMKERASLDGLIPVAISTGRISADMVRLMSAAGIRIIASFRHVLASGASEADKSGLTLISKDHTRSLKVFTHRWRVRGGPVVSVP